MWQNVLQMADYIKDIEIHQYRIFLIIVQLLSLYNLYFIDRLRSEELEERKLINY